MWLLKSPTVRCTSVGDSILWSAKHWNMSRTCWSLACTSPGVLGSPEAGLLYRSSSHVQRGYCVGQAATCSKTVCSHTHRTSMARCVLLRSVRSTPVGNNKLTIRTLLFSPQLLVLAAACTASSKFLRSWLCSHSSPRSYRPRFARV
jgi:hypothetical protein